VKAFILAAGKGIRMHPLTLTTAKALLEVGNRPLIEHIVRALVAAGIRDLVINLHHYGDKIQAHLGGGEQFGATIQYSHEEEMLETAGGILNALTLIGTRPFIVVNADIFTDYDFSQLVDVLPVCSGQEGMLGHLVLVANPDHNPNGDFALSRIKVNGIPLLSSDDDYKLTWSGISVLHPDLFVHLAPGKSTLPDLFAPAIAAGRMTGEYFQGAWTDVGTPERLRSLNQG